MGLFALRPHQQKAMDLLRQSIASGHRRPVLQAPTGFGKTIVAAHVMQGALSKGKRAVFIVPALSLIDQSFERFAQNGIDPGDMGVIQGDHEWRRPQAPIQIASVQTLLRRGMPDVGLIIADEAHVRSKWLHDYLTAPENQKVIAVGLTATPWAAGMGLVYDDLLKPISMRDLIAQGYLSPYRVFAPSHPDLTGVKTIAGDYHEGQLAERMSKPQLVADVVSTWLEKANGLATLCFCVNRAHARLVHDQFEREGILVAYVDAQTPRDERVDIGKRLEAGDIQVVCNIGCLTTGIDWDIRCIIMARPTKSQMLFVQIIGRGLRTAPGKDHLLILDHSDTHLRLGMVDDIDHDELSTGKAKIASKSGDEAEDRIPLPKECPKCSYIVASGEHECPSCGHQFKRFGGVESVDGELTEITRGRRVKGKKPQTLTEKIAAKGKQIVFWELTHYAKERGRSTGWAAHFYRSIFGVWPRGLTEDGWQDHWPSADLRGLIRQRDIAFAKSQEKRRGAA